jgi:tRNA(Ile)-lysidine synthase
LPEIDNHRDAEIGDAIPVADAVRAALDVAVAKSPEKLVVAVSGGRDSMALMHALARWFPRAVAAIATFDHGSGAAATDAAALVAAEARRLGLTVIRERSRAIAANEDAWRTARWSFLKRVARGYRGVVATAHTRDDQVETIVMRQMRGTGARGLAALAASSTIVRPWLPLTRLEVATWAEAEGIPHVDDPTNFTRKYFRSRVRLDLLPALEAAHPGFAESMLSIGDAAAHWRRDVEALVGTMGVHAASNGSPPGSLRVPTHALTELDDSGLAVVWPALLARIGVALNRRGTEELVRFTRESASGAQLELAGGASVLHVRVDERRRDTNAIVAHFELRPPIQKRISVPMLTRLAGAPLPARHGAWRFKPVDAPGESVGAGVIGVVPDVWLMPLAAGTRYDVRSWRDGDRIRTSGAPAGRRVARYLSEAHVPMVDRRQWPVVLLDEEIVWVPGVCRSCAAPNRPGRPAVIWYRCEREHG